MSDNSPTKNTTNQPNQSVRQRYHAVLPSFFGHSVFLLCVFVVAVLLIYQYWYGEYGRYALNELNQELMAQQQINEHQQQKNDRLRADVQDLKTGLVAIEEHARVDLGLIKKGEVFVQLVAEPTSYSEMPKPTNEPDAVEVLDMGEPSMGGE